MPDKWYAGNVDDRDALKKGGFNRPLCIAPAFVGNGIDWVLEFYVETFGIHYPATPRCQDSVIGQKVQK